MNRGPSRQTAHTFGPALSPPFFLIFDPWFGYAQSVNIHCWTGPTENILVWSLVWCFRSGPDFVSPVGFWTVTALLSNSTNR